MLMTGGHAVQIEPGLQRQSPKNGNISNIRRRLSESEATQIGPCRPFIESPNSAIGGAFPANQGQNLFAPDWLAGAGGIETPNGGIKIK
jgi:hypothetical protein